VPSLLAAIGEIIETHMIRTGFLASARLPGQGDEAGAKVIASGERRGNPEAERSRGKICPRCNALSLRREEGCWVCDNCGYSKCN
jgi:ribonucleoside-diphosphate reductase alpha chain